MKNLDFFKRIKIVHRGLWNDEVPENSIGAFERCIEKKIPIEFDVHLLKDNTLVVFHDNNLKRMCNIDINLKDVTYDEIKDYKLKNTNYKIPTLDEVLKLVDGKVLLDIEIKCDVDDFKICDTLVKALEKYNGKYIIKSFNPFYVWWFRKNKPDIVRGLLVSKLKKKKINRCYKYVLYNMWFNFVAKPDFIAFNYKNLPNKKIEKYKSNGMPILLFTLNKDNLDSYLNEDYGVIFEEN